MDDKELKKQITSIWIVGFFNIGVLCLMGFVLWYEHIHNGWMVLLLFCFGW